MEARLEAGEDLVADPAAVRHAEEADSAEDVERALGAAVHAAVLAVAVVAVVAAAAQRKSWLLHIAMKVHTLPAVARLTHS